MANPGEERNVQLLIGGLTSLLGVLILLLDRYRHSLLLEIVGVVAIVSGLVISGVAADRFVVSVAFFVEAAVGTIALVAVFIIRSRGDRDRS